MSARLGPARRAAIALAVGSALGASTAHADLGQDLRNLEKGLEGQARSATLKLRLMERGEIVPIVVPPWALDVDRGECTTLVLLAPIPTQFVVHVHPWPGLPNIFSSSAGGFELTRCGRERASLLQVMVEMRSPRAVVHSLVAVGSAPPAPLSVLLPERDAGEPAPATDPGPAPEREPLTERVRRFAENAKNAGAIGVDTAFLPSQGYVRLNLEPGCHRLLATSRDGAPPATLLLAEKDDDTPERHEPLENGDVLHELCTARARRLLVSVDTSAENADAERSLSVAHFALPIGLPARFGTEVAQRLVQALGSSSAPPRLGPLVAVTLGAQGRTPLPRALLPATCYVAAATAIHGAPQAISLGIRVGASNAEATSAEGEAGPHVGFCTGKSGQVDLDVEARGIGLAWQFFLFQMGPARPVAP